MISAMSDTEEEGLTIAGSGANTGIISLSEITGAPPFAPRPHYSYGQNTDRDKICRTSTSTGRSVTLATVSSTQQNAGPVMKTCGFHEICYYIQLFIFISAVLTGIALVIAGAVMHSQYGELVVFVYIGGLLVCVNSALLAIQCFVHRKQKSRLRCYTNTSRNANSSIHGSTMIMGTQQYIPVNSMNAIPPSLPTMRGTLPANFEQCQAEVKSRPSPVHFMSESQNVPPQSPRSPTYTDLQIKYLSPTHSAMSYKQSSINIPHTRHSRDKPRYHHSPPLGMPRQSPTTYHVTAVGATYPHNTRPMISREEWTGQPHSNYKEVRASTGRGARDGTSAVHLL